MRKVEIIIQDNTECFHLGIHGNQKVQRRHQSSISKAFSFFPRFLSHVCDLHDMEGENHCWRKLIQKVDRGSYKEEIIGMGVV